jgi:short-subunit dehydrogenase
MDFKGKSIIITGASLGIGKVLAIELAKKGANLTLAARDRKNLGETVEQCLKVGGKAIAVITDVAEIKDCQNLIEQAVKAYGQIDVLVNNAGISMWARFEDIKDLSMFEKMIKINYLGAVYCTYYALPYIKKTKGLIVGVSSVTGKTGVPTRSGYAASKHAMHGFFDSLRIELRGTGVGISLICPGFVATGIRDRALGVEGRSIGQSPRDENQNNMSVEECVQLMIDAMEKRKRELIMTTKARLGQWIKLLAPEIVDTIAEKAVKEKGS